MSFGNRSAEHGYHGNPSGAGRTPLHPSKAPNNFPLSNSNLKSLNKLGGLGDLASPSAKPNKNSMPNLGKVNNDAKNLNHDLNGLEGGNLNDLGKGLKDAGKLNKDAGNPLSSLNNLAGDLGGSDQGQASGQSDKGKDNQNNDFDNLAKAPDPTKDEDPRAALNDLGSVGSLASAKGNNPKSAKDSLKDINQLNNDLKHPEKIKNPMKDLKAANNLKNGGLDALGFGPLEGPMKNAAQEGFGHDPKMDKVADGSIMPRDLHDPNMQQQRNNNRPPVMPPKGLFNHLKNGAHKVGRAIARGAKGAVHHVSQGIIGGVKALTGKTIAQAVAVKAAVATMAIPVMVGGGAVGALYHNYSDYQVLDDGNICSVANSNGSGYADADDEAGDSAKGGGGSGDFKSSAQAKKHAKAVFKAWVDVGFSGMDAAGVVGWVNSEGGFGILDRAEGHYGNDEKGNGIAYGVQPINDQGGGGGIYQFTPYTKFAPLNDKKWLSASAQNKFVLKSLKNNDWNPAMDLSGKNRSFKEWLKSDNVRDATLGWNSYERGAAGAVAAAKDKKVADAKAAYRMFHGSEYKLRMSLIGNISGATADANASVAEKINNAICKATGGGNGGPVVAGKWGWPFPGFKKSMVGPDQDFGPRSIGWHDGIDIGTASYTGDIHAIHGGRVAEISCKGNTQNDLGYNIVIQSPDGWSEVYQEFAFSMSDGKKVSKVKVGDSVKTGQVIAKLSSSTPNTTHIHIGVYHGSAKQLMSDGWPHSFVPNYPGWKDPIKIIEKGMGK